MKPKNMTTLSPSFRKTDITCTGMDGFSDFDCENESPPAKLRRTSLFTHKSKIIHSPRIVNERLISEGVVDACKMKESVSDFESPPAKLRTSFFAHKNSIVQSPTIVNKKPNSEGLVDACSIKDSLSDFESPPVKLGTTLFVHKNSIIQSSTIVNKKPILEGLVDACTAKGNTSDFDSQNESSPLKSRLSSLLVHKSSVIQSPKIVNERPFSEGLVDASAVKEKLSDLESQNENPAAKLRRTSLFAHKSVNLQSPRTENKRPFSEGLLGSCRKLANLAVSRGSMDDITVMLVDLKHFKSGKT